ncbi:MAG: Rid family detoxifying hydrolase [Synergistes jonesii]|uniref:Rid family detoxifying hydrolase n=1 Tax=Synergistes jonesii TaxID=2754 RepID=UPI002A750F55|nr:Rid family detoxifying hydrolase [Synergistes jonesii]MDY2983706.1 Rid family detoxifying hydrolase [Synergistes jonesii]
MNQICTTKAPVAIGSYSQGVEKAGTIYVSGQLPLDPVTGKFPEEDIKVLTRQSMKNIAAILEAAGSSLDCILSTIIFVTDLGNFAEVNAAYAESFSGIAPARTCVQVAALPKGAPIEISAIAFKK